MYRLTKLSVEEGSCSIVAEGTSTTLPFLSALKPDERPEEREFPKTFADIEVGDQVHLGSMTQYHRTSAITEILEVTENRIKFKTQTSIYELVESDKIS